ncbi:MAG: metalloregulator ArsR/SmtB family transcription factor [Actinomycetota bacterium]
MDTTNDGSLVPAAELLRALAHEHRLAIVLELREGPRCVHELVEALGVTQPLVSQHLRVLRSLDLVTGQRRGREIAYSLGDEHVAHIVHDAVVHATERGRRRATPTKGER